MKNLTGIFGTLLFCLFFTSCECDYIPVVPDCDKEVIISESEYSAITNPNLTINSLEINGDCLSINFSSSGCSGDTWVVKLIDSSEIMESDPPQRNIKLSIENEEVCDAWITKEMSFDISSLQVDGNRVWLNLKNSDDQILYEY